MTATYRPQAHVTPRRVITLVAIVAAMLVAGPLTAHAVADEGTYDVVYVDERPVEGEHYHVVEAGEYLSTIAADYGLDEADGWQVLYDANDTIDDPDMVHVGQELLIPEEGQTLTARSQTATEAESTDPEPTTEDEGSSEPEESPEPEQSSETDEQPQASTSGNGGTWDRLAECESNGNWQINTGNGFYGGLQFDKSSWDWAGGQQYAEYPHEASREQQIAVAEQLLAIHPAGWGAWPACADRLGLR